MYIYKACSIKKTEMGSGGSSRRKDADDDENIIDTGDNMINSDFGDQGNDDSELEEQKRIAQTLSSELDQGNIRFVNDKFLDAILGEQVSISRRSAKELLDLGSKDTTQVVKERLLTPLTRSRTVSESDRRRIESEFARRMQIERQSHGHPRRAHSARY